MLRLFLQSLDVISEKNGEVYFDDPIGGFEVELEHSLKTVAAFESATHTPFPIAAKKETFVLDYVRYMCQTKDVDDRSWACLTPAQLGEIHLYINDPMTATTISNYYRQRAKTSNRIVSAEMIYSWMFQLQIPLECENWHLNRLMTLIEVCAIDQSPKKKMSRRDSMAMQRQINEANKARFRTKG